MNNYFNSKPILNKKKLKAESFLNYINSYETIKPNMRNRYFSEDIIKVVNGKGIKVYIHNDLKETFEIWINKK